MKALWESEDRNQILNDHFYFCFQRAKYNAYKNKNYY